MGHAHHFLSRLDRLSLPHVELALSLYNDAELLRYVLQHVRLPEGAARTALCLGDDARGPFLVVTREGRFVTALGEGMSPGELPVIPRGQLDAIAAKVTDLRARIEAAQRLAGPRGGVAELIRRMYEAAEDLTREEFVAISALQPLYAAEFFSLCLDAAHDLRHARDLLLPELRRSDRLKPQLHEVARSYWNCLWALGHLSVLSAMDGWGPLERLPDLEAQLDELSYSWGPVRQGIHAIALKGAWGAARLGKRLLPGYKRRFAKASSFLTTIDAGLGLLGLGLRHAKLSAEVQKAIAGGLAVDRGSPLGRLPWLIVDTVKAFGGIAFAAPEVIAESHRKLGAGMAVGNGARLPKGSPFRYAREEDVPEDLAMTMVVNATNDFLRDPKSTQLLFAALPWVARAAPEQLYLPREYIRATRVPWTPAMTCAMLRTHRDLGKPKPKRPEGPARNGPCPCGSGKKYKRCCGDGQAA